MSGKKPPADNKSPREIRDTIRDAVAEGVQARASTGIGDFDPNTLGFSKVVNVRGEEVLTYTQYSGIASLAVAAFIENFPDRVSVEDKHTWMTDGDVLEVVYGTLHYLNNAGLLLPKPGEANG